MSKERIPPLEIPWDSEISYEQWLAAIRLVQDIREQIASIPQNITSQVIKSKMEALQSRVLTATASWPEHLREEIVPRLDQGFFQLSEYREKLDAIEEETDGSMETIASILDIPLPESSPWFSVHNAFLYCDFFVTKTSEPTKEGDAPYFFLFLSEKNRLVAETIARRETATTHAGVFCVADTRRDLMPVFVITIGNALERLQNRGDSESAPSFSRHELDTLIVPLQKSIVRGLIIHDLMREVITGKMMNPVDTTPLVSWQAFDIIQEQCARFFQRNPGATPKEKGAAEALKRIYLEASEMIKTSLIECLTLLHQVPTSEQEQASQFLISAAITLTPPEYHLLPTIFTRRFLLPQSH
jgi:hypothetical protein